MSAILGLFAPHAPPDPALLPPLLGRMAHRGAEELGTWSGHGGALAVSRFRWETDPGIAGEAEVAWDGRCAVAADATLYGRAALRRRLEAAGHGGGPGGVAHLILAAYRAWGTECAANLDGDFAFVLWDTIEQRVLCARDPGGKRPLCCALLGDVLVVASTPGAIVAHPRCPPDLHLATVGATAAGMVCSAGDQSVFRAIRSLPAGHALNWRPGTEPEPRRFWDPQVEPRCRMGFAEGADHLRDLLAEAVRERLSPAGPTAVWMSGGWDSTAVFGAGRYALGASGAARLRPVSISYPPDDPGREDELIQAIARFSGTAPHWIEAEQIPLLEAPERWATQRDEPFAHLYERWNRALAAGSRACDARVALDGNGGDQLFQVTDVFMADLFRRGRWWSLARAWRGKGGRGVHNALRWVIVPALPPALIRAASILRRRPVPRGYLERPPPPWVRADFQARHHLAERERAALPPHWPGRRAEAEMYWYLTSPVFARAFAAVASFALQEGIELRSPLYARSVIEFAASRPREDRSTGPETKRLLRQAMHGLLPPEVLARRSRRTGLTRAYSARQMHRAFPALRTIFAHPLLLAELGIVEPGALQAAFESFLATGSGAHRVELFHTLQAELWLRAHATHSSEDAPPGGAPDVLSSHL